MPINILFSLCRCASPVLPSLSFPGVPVQDYSCAGSLGDDFDGNQEGPGGRVFGDLLWAKNSLIGRIDHLEE